MLGRPIEEVAVSAPTKSVLCQCHTNERISVGLTLALLNLCLFILEIKVETDAGGDKDGCCLPCKGLKETRD